MRRLLLSLVLTVAATAQLTAQTPLDQAISAKFPLTKATADRSDLVTAGAVMTLKKDHVIMFATTSSTRSNLVYKDGKVQPTLPTRMAAFSFSGKPATNVAQRTYVAGEKLWLVDVKDESDGVVLQLLSDPVSDVRYTTFVKFPFAKGATPAPDAEIKEISELMDSDGGGAPAAAAAAPAAPAPPPVAAAPLPAIPPPPPPPDQAAVPPPTLEKGQTKDQVVAGFGPPLRVVKVGATKEIDYYKDMKVTYVNGKVTNVE